jgi:hypothetical protein
MYKILVRLHTQAPGVYRFLSQGGYEFGTEDLEEAVIVAKQILKTVGYNDVKIIDDKDYHVKVISYSTEYVTDEDLDKLEKLLGRVGSDELTLSSVSDYEIDIVFDKQPEEDIETYVVTLEASPEFNIEQMTSEIEEGGSARFPIGSIEDIGSFHITINGEMFSEGLPPYIIYENGTLTIKDIHDNLVVMLIKD